MLSRISSNVLLKSVIALMSAAVVMVLAGGAWDAWHDLRASSRLATIADASGQTFRAMHNMRVVRSFTARGLDSDTVIDPQQEKMLDGFRSSAVHALQSLLAVLPRAALADGDGLARRLAQSLASLTALSDEASKNFHRPKAQRRLSLAAEFDSMARGLLEFLQSLDDRLAAEALNRDPFVDRMMALEDAAWVVRSAMGDVSMMVTTALGAKSMSPEQHAQLMANVGRATAAWDLFEKLREGSALPDEVTNAIKAAQDAVFGPEMVATRDRLTSALAAAKPADWIPTQWSKFSIPRLDKVTGLAETVLEAAKLRAEANVVSARWNLTVKGVLFAAALVLAIAGILAVSRRVINPLQKIQAAMQKVADGDLDAEVPFLDRADEIGGFAQALATFKRNASEKVRMEAEQQARRERAGARQVAVEQHITAFERQIQEALRALTAASGDMRTTSQTLSATASQTDGQARSAVTLSNETSSNVQTVATASEELASSIAEISRQVSHAAVLAKRAVGETEETDAAVNSLTQAAKHIGQIVSLITAIAEQTNLLALNATIEAARAGDAGRGFTVVAAEVKSLANQTAKATEDISAQVAAIQGIAGKAADAMRRIGGTIGEVSTVATSIASAVEEQGAATHEITRNTQEAARRTQSVSEHIAGVTAGADATGVAAEGVKKSAELLNRETDTLRQRVDEFLSSIRAA